MMLSGCFLHEIEIFLYESKELARECLSVYRSGFFKLVEQQTSNYYNVMCLIFEKYSV